MDRSRRRLGALAPALLLVSVGAILLVVTFARHMGVDEAVWNCMGRMWAHGQPVYQATMDNKPPGIFMVFTLAYALAGPGVWLPRLLGVLSLTAATGGIYLLGRRLHSRQAGLLAALMFGLAMGWEALDGPNAAQTESFMVLPTVFAFLILFWCRADPGPHAISECSLGDTKDADKQGCHVSVPGNMLPQTEAWHPRSASHLSRSWIFLAGALIGCAISFKQTALFNAPAWVVMYLALAHREGQRTPSRRRTVVWDMAAFGAGVLAGMAAFLLPVLACGVRFEDYWFGTWVLPSLPGTANPSAGGRLARTYALWCQTSLVLFYLPLAAFIWRSKALRTGGLPVVAMAVWMAMEFAGSALSGFWYGHQIKQVMPVLALMSGLGLASAIEKLSQPRLSYLEEIGIMNFLAGAFRSRRAVFAVLMVAVTMAWMPLTMLRKAIHGPGRDLTREVGLCVRDRSNLDDYVLNLDTEEGVRVLAWLDRPSPSRWFNGLFIGLPKARQDLDRDIPLHPPRFIVAPRYWRHEDFHWPACIEPLRSRCKIVCTDVMDETAYDVYEFVPPP